MRIRFVLLVAAVLALLAASPVAAAPSAPSGEKTGLHQVTPSDQVEEIDPMTPWTVNYVDASGKRTKMWSGPKWQAEQVVAQLQGPITSIHREYQNCTTGSSFWKVYNQGLLCFADAGWIGVNIYSVSQISSGNNAGCYETVSFPTCSNNRMTKNSTDYFGGLQHVTYIQIF